MELKDVDLRNSYRRWKRDTNEYRCFFRSTPFVSLKTYGNFTLYEETSTVDKKLVNKIVDEIDEELFTIVDLDFNDIIDISLELNNVHKIKPILNINLLFNEFGLIGDRTNITKLIDSGMKLENNKCNKYIMMIPYDRYMENVDIEGIKDKLNNQYTIGFDDLPDEEFLKELGYKGIQVITKSEVKEDLMEYVNYIKSTMEVKLMKVG